MIVLEPWSKFLAVAAAAAAVAITVAIVACLVQRGCCLHDFFYAKKKKNKLNGSLKNGGTAYGSAEKIVMTHYLREKSQTAAAQHPYHHHNHGGSVKSNSSSVLSEGGSSTQSESGNSTHNLITTNSSRQQQDSNYFSMSSGGGRCSPLPPAGGSVYEEDEEGEEGSGGGGGGGGGTSSGGGNSIRHCNSPTSPPVHKNSFSSPTVPPTITVSLLLTHPVTTSSSFSSTSPPSSTNNSSTAVSRLAVAVESVAELPFRDYGAHCDPWVAVHVIRARKSLRRRPSAQLAYFRTKTIRHAHNPFYSQTFVADVTRGEAKDVSVRFVVMDQDRHIGAYELNRATVTLREANQTSVADPERVTLTLLLVPGHPPGGRGEIQFGLSYLPTAQRLSFSIHRATNIKWESLSSELAGVGGLAGAREGSCSPPIRQNPYVKILMFNQSSRLVKKKKSSVMYDVKEPNFDETINFEVEYPQLETSTFLILLCCKAASQDQLDREGGADSSDQESVGGYNPYGDLPRHRKSSHSKPKDTVIGRVSLGKHVRGKPEQDHWTNVTEHPRKVFVVNHLLK